MNILILFLLFISLQVRAHRVHLFAATGINASTYGPRETRTIVGGGLNLKADLSYFFVYDWAIEASTHVKFIKTEDYLIWDTLMTAGLRRHFWKSGHFFRLFYGRSPTVVFLQDAPEVIRETNSSRLQFDGPVYGLGAGRIFVTDKGKEWFFETDLTYQVLEKETGLRNDGDVPVEVFSNKRTGGINVFSIHFNIGMRIF